MRYYHNLSCSHSSILSQIHGLATSGGTIKGSYSAYCSKNCTCLQTDNTVRLLVSTVNLTNADTHKAGLRLGNVGHFEMSSRQTLPQSFNFSGKGFHCLRIVGNLGPTSPTGTSQSTKPFGHLFTSTCLLEVHLGRVDTARLQKKHPM